MDQFVTTHAAFDGAAQGPLVMGYFDRSDLPFYYTLADAFTICDAYHCCVMGPTMPNRLYSLSATIDPTGANGGPVTFTPDLTGPTAAEAVGSVRWPTMPRRSGSRCVVEGLPSARHVGRPGLDQNLALAFNSLLYFEQYLADPSSALYHQAFLPVWPDEFMADISAHTLPQVSSILPPLVDFGASVRRAGERRGPRQPGHPGARRRAGRVGQDGRDRDVRRERRVFDHVAPPTPPSGTPGEFLSAAHLPRRRTASLVRSDSGSCPDARRLTVQPGYVNSDVFDHTSLLRLLERALRGGGAEPHELAAQDHRRSHLHPEARRTGHLGAGAAIRSDRQSGVGRGVPRQPERRGIPRPGAHVDGAVPPDPPRPGARNRQAALTTRRGEHRRPAAASGRPSHPGPAVGRISPARRWASRVARCYPLRAGQLRADPRGGEPKPGQGPRDRARS